MISLNNKELDLTSGNLFKKLIQYSFPLFLTTVLTGLFTTADLFTVGHFGGGNTSMSAVGANNALINMLSCFFVGFSVGANVLCANFKGKGDKDSAFKTIRSSMIIALISGVLLTLIGCLSAKEILKLMQVDELIIDKATLYLRIYFGGSIFNLLYNFGSSILRAFGDSTRPLIVLALSGIFNVGLNFLFVVGLNMDVAGVGIATVISQAVSAILIIIFLLQKKGAFAYLEIKKIKLYKKESFDMIKIGLGVGLTSFVFTISNVVIQTFINTLGTKVTAASAASANIEAYQYYLLNAISISSMSMVSANNGASNKENIKKTLKASILLEFIAVFALGGIMCLLRRPLLNLLISDKEADYEIIIGFAEKRFILITLTYFLCGFMEVLCNYLRGLKYSFMPTLITIFGSTILRILFVFTLFKLDVFHNFISLVALYPVTWVITSLIYICIIPTYNKKAFKKIDELSKEKVNNSAN